MAYYQWFLSSLGNLLNTPVQPNFPVQFNWALNLSSFPSLPLSSAILTISTSLVLTTAFHWHKIKFFKLFPCLPITNIAIPKFTSLCLCCLTMTMNITNLIRFTIDSHALTALFACPNPTIFIAYDEHLTCIVHNNLSNLLIAAVKCSELTAPPNLIMDCSGPFRPFSYSSICDFSCKDGFNLQGSDRLQCDVSGQWTSKIPICKGIPNNHVKC